MNIKMSFSPMVFTEKLPAGDPNWAKFTASFVNTELPLIEIANEIYSGHAFTVWHRNHRRSTENYLLGQHLGLDFDTEDERSTLHKLKKDRFIERYGALIYTTPSHTPYAPRARVVFVLDTPIHRAENYVAAAKSLIWVFGKADPKCSDAARFFYGSVRCDMEYLDNVLPLSVVRELIDQRNKIEAGKKKEPPRESSTDADKITDSIILKAADGERNSLGFWLACTLFSKGLPREETERHLLRYQRGVTHLGKSPYSEQEALASVSSAYRTVQRGN